MSTTTLRITDTASEVTLERVTFWLLLAFVAALQLSIAAANVLLALTFLCWMAGLVRARTAPSAPRFFLVLAAYAVATLVSSAFSFEPRTSFIDDKQLLLFALVPIVYDVARGRRAEHVVDVLIAVGAASAAFGIIQYGVLHYDNLGQRPDGALSHYMTYSGILMLVVCAAAARLIFGSRDRIWPALVMPALMVALAVTLTRNAWIGTAVAVATLFLLKDFRLVALAPFAIAAVFFLAPASVTDRAASTFNAKDPTSQDRLAMLEIGARITRDFPLTGVGPNMIPRVYARYRPDYAVNAVNPHLHNVPVQIMAERGLPALLIWAAFVVVLSAALLRLFRNGERLLAATGLAAMAAMLSAGLFEYNFGDSEFLMTFLILVTLPFAAARDAHSRAAAADRADRAQTVSRAFAGAPILVIGDAMLDRFIAGRVTRISPEAPVPVVAFEHEMQRIGGAANVAHNLAALGARATLVAVTGVDEAAETLARECRDAGIAPSLVGDPSRRTTTKVRIVTERNQQVARIDYESDTEISGEIEQRVIAEVQKHASHAAAIVISDYLKGCITRRVVQAAVSEAARTGVPLLVDPKIPHIDYYAGATLVTPNHHEAETATHLRVRSEAEARDAARRFRERARCEGVLMTRGDQGMWLLTAQVEGQLPASAREVSDVTGAGDTVIATMTLALAAGATAAEAARLANEAAGIAVGRFGPATVSVDELLRAVSLSGDVSKSGDRL